MTDNRSIPPDIAECSKGAKAVYLVLSDDGPLTRFALADRLEENPRSLEYPLRQLSDAGVLVQLPDTEDGRRHRYSVIQRD